MSSPNDASAGEVIVNVFGRTDVGRTREHNEDAFVVADLTTDNANLQPDVRTHIAGPKGTLFMVADGMGGAAAGEIASAMAVDVVLSELRTVWVSAADSPTAENFVRAIKQATKAANERINTFAAAHPEYRGMGTTATIAGLYGDTLYLAQVGDSRAYLVRDGVARQITKDQSLMQKLIEAGELTEEEAEHSERRNIILQALGPEPTIKIDLTHQALRRGDTLVLCSDGLSGQVGKDEIAAIVSREDDLTAACKALIDRANENGGPDNITVIVARFDGAGLRAAGHEDEVGHRVFPLPDTGQTPAMPIDRLRPADSPAQTTPAVDGARASGATPRDSASQKTATPPGAANGASDGSTARTSGAESSPRVSASGVPLPEVSPARRSAGRVIAYVLLGLLIVAAAWFVVRHVGGSSDSTAANPKATGTNATSTKAPRT
jgi:protein phosphatase